MQYAKYHYTCLGTSKISCNMRNMHYEKSTVHAKKSVKSPKTSLNRLLDPVRTSSEDTPSFLRHIALLLGSCRKPWKSDYPLILDSTATASTRLPHSQATKQEPVGHTA